MDGNNILLFPRDYISHKYAEIHFSFIIKYAERAGIDVRLVDDTESVYVSKDEWTKGLKIFCELNSKSIIIDFSDFSRRQSADEYPQTPYFKFQCPNGNKPMNIFPCGPVFIMPEASGTVDNYFNIKRNFKYECSTDVVLNKQTPRAGALRRRKEAQSILSKVKDVDITIESDKNTFWKKHENCLSTICIPGACEDSLDRGHYELLGLGVCVISPPIPILLPWNKELIPNVHYIAIKHNFSDLIEKINWCKSHKEKCTKIGHNAKKLFDTSFTPERTWEWILKCTNEFYGK